MPLHRTAAFADLSLLLLQFRGLASQLLRRLADLPGLEPKSARLLDALIAHFLALKNSHDSDFRRRFDLMAVQRNLKALGTFGYQTVTRQNPVYIQYIPRTLRYVRENLRKHGRFSRLHDLLAAHIDELR